MQLCHWQSKLKSNVPLCSLLSNAFLHFITLVISSYLRTFYRLLTLVFMMDAARLPLRLQKASQSAASLCATVNRCVRSAGPFVTSCDSAVKRDWQCPNQITKTLHLNISSDYMLCGLCLACEGNGPHTIECWETVKTLNSYYYLKRSDILKLISVPPAINLSVSVLWPRILPIYEGSEELWEESFQQDT